MTAQSTAAAHPTRGTAQHDLPHRQPPCGTGVQRFAPFFWTEADRRVIFSLSLIALYAALIVYHDEDGRNAAEETAAVAEPLFHLRT